jgi:adenine-specific DNA methylase
MTGWGRHSLGQVSPESYERLIKLQRDPNLFADNLELRGALLDFIADFANWDNSTARGYCEASRALTAAAHFGFGGAEGSRPLVVDPFSGGASIPLEALRVGADAFASDLNPVAVLLNKIVLEYIPKYGQRLADEVRRWGEWVNREALKELGKFYPRGSGDAVPIAYLWARTIRCEGPGCGVVVPLMRSLWLSKKSGVALKITKQGKTKPTISLEVQKMGKSADVGPGTVRRSACICPVCGFTTPDDRVRKQFVERNGGANDSRLIAIVTNKSNHNEFRNPDEADISGFQKASRRLKEQLAKNPALVPNEPLPYLRSIFNVHLLGIDTWGKLFNDRQSLALVTLANITQRAAQQIAKESDAEFAVALASCMSLGVDRCLSGPGDVLDDGGSASAF